MPQNDFDKATRSLAKMDAPGFFAWVTGLSAERLEFRGWLDTRAAALPGSGDHTGDTVARVHDPAGTQPPWAVAVEFQSEPDALMFGRLLIYLGYLWQGIKPDDERGSRFNVAAVVLNLTGVGGASRDMRWTEAGFGTQLTVRERNLAGENADEVLTGIEAGRWSRAVLPWVALMTGGDDAGIIDRWKALAEREPDFRVRVNYASLALVFSEAAKRKPIWEKALEGWNVIESEVVKGWQAEALARGLTAGRAEGRAEGSASVAIAVLETKFGRVPPEVEAVVRGCSDPAKFQLWATLAVKAATLDEFRAAAGI